MNRADAAAVCVVRVEPGPGGVRWALVSVNLDPENDPAAVDRGRYVDAAAVLERVAAFLRDAGLTRLAEHPSGTDPPEQPP